MQLGRGGTIILAISGTGYHFIGYLREAAPFQNRVFHCMIFSDHAGCWLVLDVVAHFPHGGRVALDLYIYSSLALDNLSP